MAGRENQGDLWYLASGLDLQLPIVCAHGVSIPELKMSTDSL